MSRIDHAFVSPKLAVVSAGGDGAVPQWEARIEDVSLRGSWRRGRPA